MRKFILFLLLCSLAGAQSFPGSLWTPLVAKDNISTTLSSAMASGDNVAVVASGTGWAVNMVAYICDATTPNVPKCTGTFEAMLVTGVSGNVLTVTRGYGSTSAAAHLVGKTISNSITAVYYSSISSEVQAIETALGPNLTNVSQSTNYIAAVYNFTAQTPGGSLAAGNNTITMTPVPKGVNWNDTAHRLYVSGGTGTAEACLIAGGSGTSGQATGSIVINCANTHSGAWTIQSATGGIAEALILSKAAGRGNIRVSGAVTIYGTITLPNNIPVGLMGDGISATTLTLAAGVNADMITNESFSTLTGGGTAPAGIYRVTIADMTLDGNKSSQTGGTSFGIRIYGHGYTLRDVAIQSFQNTGIWSEYALNPAFSDTTRDVETFWNNVRVSFSGGDNIIFRGPHDSYWNHITSYQAGGWCTRMQSDGANYNGNVHITDMDNYLCGTGACQVNTQISGTNLVCSTATGNGLQIDSNPGSINLAASTFSGGGTNGVGLVLTGANNNIQGFAAGTSASGGYAVQFGASAVSNNYLNLVMSCGSVGCVNNGAGSDQGQTIFTGTALSTGPLLVGAVPPASSTYQIMGTTVPSSGPQYINRTVNQSSWSHYKIAKIANGTGGCANANGCWQINGGTPVNASAALTQNIALDLLPAGAFVNAARIQTNVAFTGAATATADFGNSGNASLYYNGHYDLKAAVSSSNLADIRPSVNANTNGVQSIVFLLTTTTNNVDQIVTGSAVDFWVQWGVLQ